MMIFLAIALGFLFGFALNRAGATNPQNIINMLRLTDTGLMKTILFAIGLSAVILFSGMALGLIDTGHISVKSAYIGVIIGGALLGIGFTIAGYCPGTGLVALATGRKDALFFILGGLIGAFVFSLSYGWLKAETALFDKISGGKVTLAVTGNDKFPALFSQIDGTLFGIIFGLIFMGIAILVPRHILSEK